MSPSLFQTLPDDVARGATGRRLSVRWACKFYQAGRSRSIDTAGLADGGDGGIGGVERLSVTEPGFGRLAVAGQ